MTARDAFRYRLAIWKALNIDPLDGYAAAAIAPFSVVRDDKGFWIAGAVGHQRGLTYGAWHPTGDVILWNPRTGETRLKGETRPALVTPFRETPRLTVYADGFAFFRAWADERAALTERQAVAVAHHRAAIAEPADSAIPGALAIGDLKRLPFASLNATTLVAGPGIDARDLNRAVLRSANLPRVESLAA